MEEQLNRTTVNNERAKDRTFEEDVNGFRENRFEKVTGAKVDDIGIHPQLKLREGDESDDREAMIAAIRADAAKATEVVEKPVAESLENLTDVERACLEAMEADRVCGIVVLDPKDEEGNALEMDGSSYQAALKENPTAGLSEEALQEKLLANGAALLKRCVELSKLTGDQEGRAALLVGVYENGELAIRQRSQEIVNARWTKDWKDGDTDKGELQLLFHPEAITQEEGRWAKAVEILRAVKAAGYHVPADAPDYNKKWLVAASEAVTGADYVASPNRDKWRDAILECPDNVDDSADVRVVNFFPAFGNSNVDFVNADLRANDLGAVLWLRG